MGRNLVRQRRRRRAACWWRPARRDGGRRVWRTGPLAGSAGGFGGKKALDASLGLLGASWGRRFGFS
eukprot:5119212-Pyramimonas_sp.AAC.1